MSVENVVLIGFSGSGKSVVGRLLAERLGFALFDTDAMVEAAAGRRVPAIFAEDGEVAFREREAAAVTEATTGTGRVIACGGGAVLALRNYAALRDAGPIVYLRATAETIIARLGAASDRPLLRDDPAATVPALLAEREAAYRSAADMIVATDDRTPEEVADEIERRLKERA